MSLCYFQCVHLCLPPLYFLLSFSPSFPSFFPPSFCLLSLFSLFCFSLLVCYYLKSKNSYRIRIVFFSLNNAPHPCPFPLVNPYPCSSPPEAWPRPTGNPGVSPCHQGCLVCSRISSKVDVAGSQDTWGGREEIQLWHQSKFKPCSFTFELEIVVRGKIRVNLSKNGYLQGERPSLCEAV
mgnify:CR=1 FL=1